MYRNCEHYPSPTEGEAYRHIIREEKKKARRERMDKLPMKLAWESPKYKKRKGGKQREGVNTETGI